MLIHPILKKACNYDSFICDSTDFYSCYSFYSQLDCPENNRESDPESNDHKWYWRVVLKTPYIDFFNYYIYFRQDLLKKQLL